MEQRTDTGCMLPGRGDNSPLPEVAPDRSLEQRMHDLEQRVAQLEADNHLLRTALLHFLSPQSPPSTPPRHLPDDQNHDTLDEPAAKVEEEPIAQLPNIFVFSLRHDTVRANLLIHLLRDIIMPEVSKRSHRHYRWCHVKHVMTEHRLIVENTSLTDFGRAMEQLLGGGVKAENVRKTADDFLLPKGVYTDWPDGNANKEACLEVKEALTPVL